MRFAARVACACCHCCGAVAAQHCSQDKQALGTCRSNHVQQNCKAYTIEVCQFEIDTHCRPACCLILYCNTIPQASFCVQVEEDPTGGKYAGAASALNGAPHKLESIIQFHVGDVVTSLQRRSCSLVDRNASCMAPSWAQYTTVCCKSGAAAQGWDRCKDHC